VHYFSHNIDDYDSFEKTSDINLVEVIPFGAKKFSIGDVTSVDNDERFKGL